MSEISLEFPVSVNAMYRAVGGRNKLSAAARAWKEGAGWDIAKQKPEKHKGPVTIQMTYTPPDHRRRDADNFVKIVLDALVAGGVIEDDCTRIIRARHERWEEPNKEKAGVKITVNKWEDSSAS